MQIWGTRMKKLLFTHETYTYRYFKETCDYMTVKGPFFLFFFFDKQNKQVTIKSLFGYSSKFDTAKRRLFIDKYKMHFKYNGVRYEFT